MTFLKSTILSAFFLTSLQPMSLAVEIEYQQRPDMNVIVNGDILKETLQKKIRVHEKQLQKMRVSLEKISKKSLKSKDDKRRLKSLSKRMDRKEKKIKKLKTELSKYA